MVTSMGSLSPSLLLSLLLLFPSVLLPPHVAATSGDGQSLRRERNKEQRVLFPLQWQDITFDTFEAGSTATWGSYRSGGSQAKLESKTFFKGVFSSTFSAVVQDKKTPPDSSFFHSNFYDVSTYDDLKVSFWIYSLNMKNVEHQFLVEYSTATSGPWYPLHTIDRFQNGVPLEQIITFSGANRNVQEMSAIKLRFRCKGKDSKTKVYVDQIRFQGLAPPPPPTPAPTLPLTRQDICPVDRVYPPSKYEILPYAPLSTTSGVEDDLSEISSLVFSDQTDAQGNLYAYVASDKNQFSIKVIRFQRHAATGLVVMGTGTTVATYALNVHYTNSDWEDISLGPCSSAPNAETCIYVGDFGNNDRGGTYVQRKVLKIHKFPEPRFQASTPQNLSNVGVTTILYNYAAPGFTETTFYDGT